MKLYYHPFSQHARRVRMLCHELNLDPELVLVALDKGEHRTPDFLKLNPTGQVPVLMDGDQVIAESHVIMKHLATNYGGGRLYPADQRLEIDRWLDWTHATLNPPVQAIAIEMFTKGDGADKTLIAVAHDRANAAIAGYDAGFGLEPVTLADFAIISTLALFKMVGGAFDAHENATRRFGEISARPSFAATAPSN